LIELFDLLAIDSYQYIGLMEANMCLFCHLICWLHSEVNVLKLILTDRLGKNQLLGRYQTFWLFCSFVSVRPEEELLLAWHRRILGWINQFW